MNSEILNRTSAGVNPAPPVRVLQFGQGNFLRAFADWMIDLLNEKAGFNGGIRIVRSTGTGVENTLNDQEGLYHVILNGISGGEAVRTLRLITSVHGAIDPRDEFEAFLRCAENPDLRFVISNTTEAGIEFDKDDLNTGAAKTFPGKLTQVLHRRFTYFKGAPDKGLIILPCELIEQNGAKLREAVLDYAGLWKLGTDFVQWVDASVQFYNTLVDRIVPGYPKANIAAIHNEIGFADKLVVTAEPYHLWVIQAPESLNDELPLRSVGLNVQFTDDLTPYRTLKVRILNGAHTLMMPIALMQGIPFVRDAVNDVFVGGFMQRTIRDEIIPVLDGISEETGTTYANTVVERFKNPSIDHAFASIALNSVSKFRVRVLPSILDNISRGKVPKQLLFAFACLIRFYKGTWNGQPLPVNDQEEVMVKMKSAWNKAGLRETVTAILSDVDLWGKDLTKIDGLFGTITNFLQKIDDKNSLSFISVS